MCVFHRNLQQRERESVCVQQTVHTYSGNALTHTRVNTHTPGGQTKCSATGKNNKNKNNNLIVKTIATTTVSSINTTSKEQHALHDNCVTLCAELYLEQIGRWVVRMVRAGVVRWVSCMHYYIKSHHRHQHPQHRQRSAKWL